jgi:hypothetical protein
LERVESLYSRFVGSSAIRGPASYLSSAYGPLCGPYEGFQRGGAYLRPSRREKQDLAFIASTLALRDYRPFLAAGEVATIAILASDRKQARAIFRFISGFLKNSRLIEALVEDENTEAIKLSNRVHIEISTASFRGTRGYTFAAVLCDEIATWRSDESLNPDKEILRALRPGMLTIPGSMLLMGSSPYSKSGELYRIYKRYFGQNDGRVLVWQGDTLSMNSKADRVEIAEAYENDPQAAMAEFGAQFRDDLIGFISLETLEELTVHGRHSLPRLPGVEYATMVDPSGGVNDSMTMAIGHRDGHFAILDRLLEIRPPFNPDDAVRECADLCRAYGITRIVSDKYAAAWPVVRFSEAGISLEQSAKPKSDLYLNFLSLANSGRVELLDNGRMLSQFAGLQRRTARSGRDSVDHARDTHDDVCNVAAGVLVGLDLDRRPSLVRQSDMLVDSVALPIPEICKYIFATLAVDKNGMSAVIYAAVMWTGPASDEMERAKEIDNAVRAADAKKRADAEEAASHCEKLDQLLTCLDALGKRMDSFEASRAATGDKDEAGEGEIERDKPKELAADSRKDSRMDSVDDDAEEIENYKRENGATHKIAADSVLAEIQSDADRASSAWGKSAVQPWDGEKITAYRRRVAREHQQHSPAWKGVDLHTLSGQSLRNATAQIFEDSVVASSSPESYPDTLIERRLRDPISGQTRIEFYGSPSAWTNQFKGGTMHVKAFRTGGWKQD